MVLLSCNTPFAVHVSGTADSEIVLAASIVYIKRSADLIRRPDQQLGLTVVQPAKQCGWRENEPASFTSGMLLPTHVCVGEAELALRFDRGRRFVPIPRGRYDERSARWKSAVKWHICSIL